MNKHLKDVLALGEQHAEEVKLPKKRLSDNEVKTVAGECFCNAVIPLLEERSADLEAKIKGATLEGHYTRAFVAAYRARERPPAKPAKATSKKKPAKQTKQAKPAPPIRGLGKAGDPKGETLAAVKAYVESGADVNALLDERDVLMESMLHLAAEHHHVAIMKYLLEHGADPNLENGHCDSCPLLKVIGHRDDNPAAVALLLDHGADPNRAEYNCELPLNDAIVMGHAKTVELLLARGADPSRKTGRSKSKTAFEWAEERGSPKISALLARASSARAPSRAPRGRRPRPSA
jgi:hypothetical protein